MNLCVFSASLRVVSATKNHKEDTEAHREYVIMPKPIIVLITFLVPFLIKAQEQDTLPILGLCIKAPDSKNLDRFITFIEEELGPKGVNTLILRVDYQYAYESRPELRGNNPLTQKEVKQLVATCRAQEIRLIPQVNLLGHQSWHSKESKLLEVYPEFDETPHVQLPEEYKWPNEDGLYCKSYCPLHPEVHEVVFDIVDEICEVFEADAFHAGMDEVFYIGDEKCPRCAGRDKAELFAGEVNKIQTHLQQQGIELWIWGDRLIDGKTTGIGIWEASYNNTHRAIDMISEEVVICDWHYERPDKTAVYFAMKGFRVLTCPWRNPEVAAQQVKDMFSFRTAATKATKERYAGMLQTIWSGVDTFLDEYYGIKPSTREDGLSQAVCFKTVLDRLQQ